jgi:ABC-type transport system substrate-binding protein
MLTNGYGAQVVRGGEWLVADLEKVGIRATIEIVEYATYFGQRWPKVEYQMAYGPQTPFLEPDEWLRAVMRTGATRNWYNLSNPELDEMLDRQTRLIDHEERVELVKDIQRFALEEVLDPIQVFNPVYIYPEQPWVKNYNQHQSYGYYAMKEVWLDQ